MADDDTPYVREMLVSQPNLYAGLGALAVGALLSIPFGFGIGAIPLIAFAAGEVVAAMYIPSSLIFRERVDRRMRARARRATRDHLITEIEARTNRRGTYPQLLQTYLRMTARVTALYRRAYERHTRLSVADVERLEDATLEYLCMWLAGIVMDGRALSVNLRDIEERVAALDRELKAPRPGTDIPQLEKARAEYLAVIERHRRMASRRKALEAAMISMPDQLEEIYEMIMTTPVSESVGPRLDEAITKLRLQADIEAELAGDLEEAVPGIVAPLKRPAGEPRRRAAAAASRSI